MLYAIIAFDNENSAERRAEMRQAHLARIQKLQDQGKLALAGPFPAVDAPDPGPAGVIGGMIVADFGSLEEAQDWAQQDPYMTAGVWQDVKVTPFRQVLP